jgi:hypothetical protein
MRYGGVPRNDRHLAFPGTMKLPELNFSKASWKESNKNFFCVTVVATPDAIPAIKMLSSFRRRP